MQTEALARRQNDVRTTLENNSEIILSITKLKPMFHHHIEISKLTYYDNQ